MDILIDKFGLDITNIILSKLCEFPCYFENCLNESMLNNYCKKHWCLNEHSTRQNQYNGYCKNCFMKK